MTKELSASGDKQLKSGKNHLDSLYASIDKMKDSEKKESTVKEIINLKQQMETFQINYSKDNSEKIWKRISDYSKLFSEQNKYKIIIGSQYNGDVVYGSEDRDVTKELLVFINKKYEGFN